MSEQLDYIKQEILDEYTAAGQINPARWLARYPEFREDLLGVFRLFDTATAAEAVPEAEPWSDFQGIVGRARQNILRMAEVFQADPAESALGEALAAHPGPFLRPLPQNEAQDEKTLHVFTLGLVVQALVRAGAHLHQYMGQKLSDLGNFGLHLGLWQHVPYAYGMFDKTIYRIEEEAAKRGWLQVRNKQYVPAPLLEREVARLSLEILSAPELTTRYFDHLARRDSSELEVWGMSRYAATQLVAQGLRITIPAVLQFFHDTPAWTYKVVTSPDFKDANITEFEVEQALEHLVRLRLIPASEVDLVT